MKEMTASSCSGRPYSFAKLILALVACCSIFFATPAQAIDIYDSSWSGLLETSDYPGCYFDMINLHLSKSYNVTIDVQDAECPGNYYMVILDGGYIGWTPNESPPMGLQQRAWHIEFREFYANAIRYSLHTTS